MRSSSSSKPVAWSPQYVVIFAGHVYKHTLHHIYYCFATVWVHPGYMTGTGILLRDLDNHAEVIGASSDRAQRRDELVGRSRVFEFHVDPVKQGDSLSDMGIPSSSDISSASSYRTTLTLMHPKARRELYTPVFPVLPQCPTWRLLHCMRRHQLHRACEVLAQRYLFRCIGFQLPSVDYI